MQYNGYRYTIDGVVHIDLKSSSPYNPVVSVSISCRPLIHAVDDAELNKIELSSLIILIFVEVNISGIIINHLTNEVTTLLMD